MNKLLLRILFDDKDFHLLYVKYDKSNQRYRKTLRDFLETNNWRSYVIPETNLGITSVTINDKIFNLDDLHEDYKNFLND